MKASASLSNSSETPASVLTKVTVLGATGSIGLNSLDIIRQFPQKFQIEALSCRNSIETLCKQIREFKPRLVCVDTSDQARELRESFNSGQSCPETEFVCGMEGL